MNSTAAMDAPEGAMGVAEAGISEAPSSDRARTKEARGDYTKRLQYLRLTRLGNDEPAGLWITSFPWPRARLADCSLNSRPTHIQPLGKWPDETEPCPRRLLLIADGGNRAPEHIVITKEGRAAVAQTSKSAVSPISKSAAGPNGPPTPGLETRDTSAARPTVEMELFERSPHAAFMWERHRLRIRQGDRSVALALGLRTGGEVHWWEACRLVVLEETAECLAVEMGGAIAHKIMTFDDLQKHPGHTNPYLHKHNWLNGHLFARIHTNGVCEIYAHHINSKFFDDGLPLQDVVPVIGISVETCDEDMASLSGPWDGSRNRLTLGGVTFDVSEAARLARADQPGQVTREGDLLVWQPYAGAEVFAGHGAQELTGDPFLCRAEQRLFPRGLARTVRFSLSLSDRSPRIARYLAPAWWFGVCEEFLPEPLLPVSNEHDASLDEARKWIRDNQVLRGFEDGAVPRYASPSHENGNLSRRESGWEGEIPYAQFLSAWRTGDADEYAAALRSAYHFTDVAVDHAAKLVRMQGYPPNAFALPLNRMQGTIAAYLETGDPYLLDTARAVTTNAFWQHKNSWPRLAVGRDACFVRSAVLLYRYFADDFFRAIAREAAMAVVHSQRPNGSFGDQGGGTGIHSWNGYITKPWMGLLAINGVLDYLELFPDEQPFQQAVRKFADWLMFERIEHDGVKGWTYQHDYNGGRRFYDPYEAQWVELPTQGRWHQENLGRLLAYCALRYNEPKYLDAWAESHRPLTAEGYDHCVSAALQFLPWVQAKLWQARLSEDGMSIRPFHFGTRTPNEARIQTPEGAVTVRWGPEGVLQAPEQ